MYLSRKGNSETITTSQVKFDKIADKFMMINIKFEYDNCDNSSDSPYYWRLKVESVNPPLEISVEKELGQIQEITVFFSAEDFKELRKFKYDTLKENTVVNTDIFKEYNYYYDTTGTYSVDIKNNMFSCIFNNEEPVTNIVQNNRISFYFNEDKHLIGFLINNIDSNELEVFRKSNLMLI